MLKSLKYLSKLVAVYVFGCFGGVFVYIACFNFVFGNDENGYIVNMLTGIVGMMCMSLCMTIYSYYSNIALSMGAPRKKFILAAQLSKLFVCTGLFAVVILLDFLMQRIYNFNPTIASQSSFVTFASFFMFTCIGETVGVVCLRYGKIGFTVYMIVCMVFGAFIGITATLGDYLYMIVMYLSQNSMVFGGGIIIVGIAMTILNLKFFSKAVVRSV